MADVLISCKHCEKFLQKYFYELDGLSICPSCAEKVRAAQSPAGRSKRTMLAILFGCIGGFIGALLFGGVAILTERFWGYLAILVGLGAGYGVKLGSENRGGLLYQGLGVGIAYIMMGLAYLGVIGYQMWPQGGIEPQAAAPPAQAQPLDPATDANAVEPGASADGAQVTGEAPADGSVVDPEAAAKEAAEIKAELALARQRTLDAGPWYLRALNRLAEGDPMSKALAAVLLLVGFIVMFPKMMIELDPLSLVFFLLAAGYAWKANADGEPVGALIGPKMLEGAVKEAQPTMEG